LLGTGKYDDITIEEVHKHINAGTILHFLRDQAGNDINLSSHMDSKAYGDFQGFYVKHLQSIYDAYAGDESRKWGVKNKGLCLLIAWTNEIIQQGTGWQANQNISER
jgi:hypothetical protein